MVFDERQLAPDRMMQLAAALKPTDIPPMVRLSVLSEEFSDSAGLAQESERLFDTPSAIARIWRSEAWSRSMELSAGETQDPNGRPLRFSWVLLGGDPQHVRIEPLEPDGRSARITLDWQDPPPLPALPESEGAAAATRTTSRVDIGVFAWNGAHWSAPAFVSISFPTHQVRHYSAGPDGSMRLDSVDYDANLRKADYDPSLHWSAPWTDHFLYDASGMTGWERRAHDGRVTLFDAQGQPLDGGPIDYRVERGYQTADLVAGPEESRTPVK